MRHEERIPEIELLTLVERARGGDRRALEGIVRALQDELYRLALRMTACPEDAADATQEILVKIVTRLDGFHGDASLRTWSYRVAVRHLLDRKKSRVERMALGFERYAADLLDGLSSEPDPDPLLAEEVRLGCTLAMLTCLDREHRIAYVLAEVFDLDAPQAAELCGIGEEAYRQRLSRARRALEAFTRSYCGLVASEAPCHCSKRVVRAIELGRVQRDAPPRATQPSLPIARRDMDALFDTAELVRTHPAHRAPDRVLAEIRAAIERTALLS